MESTHVHVLGACGLPRACAGGPLDRAELVQGVFVPYRWFPSHGYMYKLLFALRAASDPSMHTICRRNPSLVTLFPALHRTTQQQVTGNAPEDQHSHPYHRHVRVLRTVPAHTNPSFVVLAATRAPGNFDESR